MGKSKELSISYSNDFRSSGALENDAKDFIKHFGPIDKSSFSADQFYPNGAPKPGTQAFIQLAQLRAEGDKGEAGEFYNRGR